MNDDKFFDIRTHEHQQGQIICEYVAMADLVDSDEKRQLIHLLTQDDKALAASQIMKNLFGANEPDCYRIPREMADDLLKLTPEEVAKKEYRYVFHRYFYAKKEDVPFNDPHWNVVSIQGLGKFLGEMS